MSATKRAVEVVNAIHLHAHQGWCDFTDSGETCRELVKARAIGAVVAGYLPDDAPAVERATEVLAEHQRLIQGGGRCLCGEWPTLDSRLLSVTYLDHLAEALAAAGCLRDDQCRWCPPGCKSCEPQECECYTHQDFPDRALRDDREGETVTEWQTAPAACRSLPPIRGWPSRDKAERYLSENRVLMSRQRTTFPDVVTDWTPVTDGGDPS